MIGVMLNCNHWRNGAFMGACQGFAFSSDRLCLNCVYVDAGLKCQIESGRFRIGKLWLKHHGCKLWVGNWCWNEVWIPAQTAVRLVEYLRQTKGFHAEGGLMKLCEKWNSGVPFKAKDFAGKVVSK